MPSVPKQFLFDDTQPVTARARTREGVQVVITVDAVQVCSLQRGMILQYVQHQGRPRFGTQVVGVGVSSKFYFYQTYMSRWWC